MEEKKEKTGYFIQMRYKDNMCRYLFMHTLVGRMSYKQVKKGSLKRVGYYSEGILSDVEYARPYQRQIFISEDILKKYSTIEEFKDLLEIFGQLEKFEKITTDIPTRTAIDFYRNKCEELGYDFVIKHAKKKCVRNK